MRRARFSSRRIARKLEEDAAYRVLAAGNFPAHRTIAEFRQQHLAAVAALFVQVVKIAQEAGVVQLGALVGLDGSTWHSPPIRSPSVDWLQSTIEA